MATPIRLLVGLGNPGDAYQLTRHNVGANWLRALALRFKVIQSQILARIGSLSALDFEAHVENKQ